MQDFVETSGFMPADLVDDEVEWFYSKLGIDGKFSDRLEVKESCVNGGM